MKVRFHYYELKSHYGHPPSLRLGSVMIDGIPERNVSFNSVLLSAIDTDMPAYSTRHVDSALAEVTKIEAGEIDEYQYEGQGFVHHITRDRVRFEHSVFGECPEWPIWCCTLAQYKAALQGYRRFLDMPESIESELIIDLPDGEPMDC